MASHPISPVSHEDLSLQPQIFKMSTFHNLKIARLAYVLFFAHPKEGGRHFINPCTMIQMKEMHKK